MARRITHVQTKKRGCGSIRRPNDVTDDFVVYAQLLLGEGWPSIPLVNGRQRFAQLKPVVAEKKLPAYELQAWRKH